MVDMPRRMVPHHSLAVLEQMHAAACAVRTGPDSARVAAADHATSVVLLRAIVFSALAWSCAAAIAQAAPSTAASVAPGVYVLPGHGGEVNLESGGRTANVAFVVGPRGVVVVDTGISYREGGEIIAAIRRVTTRPIRLVVLTHPGQEAIFGAAAFEARGIPVLAHRRSAELIASRCATCLNNLRAKLGEDAMEGSRVPTPDRLIDRDATLDLIGRPLHLFAPAWSSAPGAIAVYDEQTATLITGSQVTRNRIPDLRDADLQGWRDALVQLEALRCRHLIPGYGAVGDCTSIAAMSRYLTALERHVRELMEEGVSLADLRNRCDLPEFAHWDQYATLHPQNANTVYLRLERAQFE